LQVTDLLLLGLTNLFMAGILAIIAFVLGRWSKNPALAHGLWLLVFIKLITPPLMRVPIPWPQPAPLTAHENAEPRLATEPRFALADIPVVEPNNDAVANMDALPPMPEIASEGEIPREVAAPQQPDFDDAALGNAGNSAAIPWLHVAGAFWLTGAGLSFYLTARRIRRFQVFLKCALPADSDIWERADRLASKLGVRCPTVWLVPGIVSPMLWSFGTARRLLLPRDLLGRLSAAQQSTLLAHELAHLRRGDHWVRYLEWIVLCFYWWCPLVWWARRELHAAEEECCDAWVVWTLPELARDYALALVETLDFLCDAKPAVPLLASGIRPVPLLRRRLTMIMRGSSPRVVTAVGGLALLCLAAVLLPLLPSLAQEERREKPPQPPRKEKEFPPPPQGGGPEVQRLHEQLEQIHRQRRELDERLEQLHRALGERREGNDKERGDRPEPKPEPRPRPFPPDREGPGGKPFDRKPGEGPGRPFDRKPGEGPGVGPLDRRLDELERKMDRLMEIVENLQRNMGDRPFPPRKDGPKGPPFGKDDKDRDERRPPPPPGERRGDDAPDRPEIRQPIDPRRETPEVRKPRPE